MYYGEKLNSITHLIGTVLSLVGLGALLTVSVQHSDPWMISSFSIFGITLIMLYASSTLYHGIRPSALKRLFQKFDHAAIYLLIAGTYTPYMLVSLRDSNGPLILAIVWSLAIVGLLVDVLKKDRVEILQISIYLVMGWLIVIDFDNLKLAVDSKGVNLLMMGGLAYTVGVVFYVLDKAKRLQHAHGIWHLFVLMGSLTHFVSILVYVR